jgi:glycosyltransferase involved in cell wall biosynthesis
MTMLVPHDSISAIEREEQIVSHQVNAWQAERNGADASNAPTSRRRKVCMLAYTEYECDNRVRRYAETLVKRGDQVEVIALSSPLCTAPKETICGVTVYRIQYRNKDEKHRWNYAWKLLRFLLSSSRTIARLHALNHYDVIHIHNMPDFLVFAAWYPKLRGAKLILDIHDLTPEMFASKFAVKSTNLYVKLLKAVERVSTRFVDHVIVSNHLWRDTLLSRSVAIDKCSVLINHVDSAIFYRRPRRRDDGKYIILFHGGFQWHQGLDIAIEAFAEVRAKLPAAELHLYGGGSQKITAELQSLAQHLSLSESVKFCGFVPLDKIGEVVADADLGVVPKRANSFGNEAYSTKIMEFMSQGVPVIVSRTKIDTYYFNERTVRFFRSGDKDALAEAILDVAGSEELRDSLIAQGLEYVQLNGWGEKKREYLDLVDTLSSQCRKEMPLEGMSVSL